MEVFTEASLSDSEMFKNLNKSSSIVNKVQKALKTGVVLDKSYIEEQYLQIERTKLSPIYAKVLKAFDDGKIKIVYNRTERVTTAVPFIVIQVGGVPTACIFIADFAPMNKDGDALSIEMKKLYTLMESAYYGLSFYSNPDVFRKNGAYMKVFATVYAEMALKILNREFALSLNKAAYDTVNYMCARFCLENIVGLHAGDLSKSYARACCKTPDNATIELADMMYEKKEITSCSGLINVIRDVDPKMSKLSFRYFFERWISSFGTGACLSIDTMPYLYYVIANVLLGGFLINVSGVSEIVKNTKGINTFYGTVNQLIH